MNGAQNQEPLFFVIPGFAHSKDESQRIYPGGIEVSTLPNFEMNLGQGGFQNWAVQTDSWLEKNFPKQKKVLIGYSMGARLAMHLYFLNPTQWSHTFLISVNPGLKTKYEKKQRWIEDLTWAHRFDIEPLSSVYTDWCRQPVFDQTSSKPLPVFEGAQLAKQLRCFSLALQDDFEAKLLSSMDQNLNLVFVIISIFYQNFPMLFLDLN